MGCVKSKLCNSLAIPMVEAILATHQGLKRRGETCGNLKILPEMLRRFNLRMYGERRKEEQPAQQNTQEEAEEEEEDMVQVLNDVEELFEDPFF